MRDPCPAIWSTHQMQGYYYLTTGLFAWAAVTGPADSHWCETNHPLSRTSTASIGSRLLSRLACASLHRARLKITIHPSALQRARRVDFRSFMRSRPHEDQLPTISRAPTSSRRSGGAEWLAYFALPVRNKHNIAARMRGSPGPACGASWRAQLHI